jgi:hypothetical protein
MIKGAQMLGVAGGLGLAVLWSASPALAVAGVTLRSACDADELSRPVATVVEKSLIGSGGFTISFQRESQTVAAAAPHAGTPIEIVRCLPPGRLVQLAKGKIDRVEHEHYLASVFVPAALAQTDSSSLTRSLVLQRNLYWQPMQGDFVRVLTPAVVARQKIWPRFAFSIEQIFETRPTDEWSNISLTNPGRQVLVESFKELETYPGRFVVEAIVHNHQVSAEQATELSQLRAGLVANYLSQVFGLNPSRLVARGLGQSRTRDGWKRVAPAVQGQPLVRDEIRIRALPSSEDSGALALANVNDPDAP